MSSETLRNPALGTLIRESDSFLDERGEIRPIVDVSNNSVAIVFSKIGSVRANHYHKTDWHYCYVISGEIKYYERNIGSKDVKFFTFSKGQTFFTPPMVEHLMVFSRDTTFLVISRNPRTHKEYESDVVRVNFLEELESLKIQEYT